MEIREFRPSDLSVLVDLTIDVFGPFYEQSFRSMVPPDVFTHQHGAWADDYRNSVPSLHDPEHNRRVAVAETDAGEIGGYVAWAVDLKRSHGEIDTLAVRESVRRHGLGRELCEHALSAMRKQDIEVVGVGTGGDWFHAPARALYESLGFHLIPVSMYLRAL
jgi:ribosomal protein S18 acetylase RimI-like enzyme